MNVDYFFQDRFHITVLIATYCFLILFPLNTV